MMNPFGVSERNYFYSTSIVYFLEAPLNSIDEEANFKYKRALSTSIIFVDAIWVIPNPLNKSGRD